MWNNCFWSELDIRFLKWSDLAELIVVVYALHASVKIWRWTSRRVDWYLRSHQRLCLFRALRESLNHGALGRKVIERIRSGACLSTSSGRTRLYIKLLYQQYWQSSEGHTSHHVNFTWWLWRFVMWRFRCSIIPLNMLANHHRFRCLQHQCHWHLLFLPLIQSCCFARHTRSKCPVFLQ